MSQELQRIEYCHGMLESGVKVEDLPIEVWSGSNILPEFHEAINEANLLDLAGTFGVEHAGDPQEYDHLKLVLTGETVEITVYNRGITLLFTDDEQVRRIHRVLELLKKSRAL